MNKNESVENKDNSLAHKEKNKRKRIQIDNKKEMTKEEQDVEEERFEQLMEEIGLKIVDCGGDGNCLFRSIAH